MILSSLVDIVLTLTKDKRIQIVVIGSNFNKLKVISNCKTSQISDVYEFTKACPCNLMKFAIGKIPCTNSLRKA